MKNRIRLVYIDYNFIDEKYPNKLSDGDSFYTYGFSSLYSRKFKKYHPDIEVECWKTDSRIKTIYEKEIEGVRIKVFPAIRIGALGDYSTQLIKHYKKSVTENASYIFNFSSFDHMLFYSLASHMKNEKIVIQSHGEATALYKSKVNSGLKKIFYLIKRSLEDRALKKVSLLNILDKNLKEHLPDSFKGKVNIQGTGVDENLFFKIAKEEAKKRIGLDPAKKYILFVGSLNYTKQVDTLINAFKKIKQSRNDIGLIIGGTKKTDILYNEAINSGAIVEGMILQSELKYFFSASEAYCLPGYKKDMAFLGIGMLPVQSLLCDVPVIGNSLINYPNDPSDVGIMTNNEEELLKAMLKILNGEVEFKQLREKALKYYSWENISQRTYNEYKQLAENV